MYNNNNQKSITICACIRDRSKTKGDIKNARLEPYPLTDRKSRHNMFRYTLKICIVYFQ